MKSIYLDDRWIKLQEEKEEGIGIQYEWKKDDNVIIYPFIKRLAGIVDNVKYYDLVTPRGQGGPRIEKSSIYRGKAVELFNEDFQKYCIENNIIAEYIRFDPWIKNYEDFSIIYEEFSKGNIFCNNLTIDFFINEYSSKTRNQVRKAEKNNVTINFDFEGKTIEEFIKIYNYTSEKYDISNYYVLSEKFLRNYFSIFKNDVCIVNAIHNEKIISSAILLFGKDIAHYHFSSTNPEYRSLQPNDYLIYKSELLSQKMNKKLFDLGRAAENSNLEKFKLGFINDKRERIYEYKVGTKIRNKKIYDILVNKNGGKHEGYFPEYR